MKKLYSILSSAALLFSLPALAAPLAERSMDSKSKGKENSDKVAKDKVSFDKGPKTDKGSPICRDGGGA